MGRGVDVMAPDLPAAALELARAGWPVFPCHAKTPLTVHGHLDGTDDEQQVLAWWQRWPSANIGSRVPDSLVVVDIDPRNGGSQSLDLLETAHGPLPVTLRSMTGGGGEHRFFLRPSGPIRNGAHKLGPGLDIKAPGKGYVILPPSVHPSGKPYAWADPATPVAAMPAWLATLLRPEPVIPRPTRAIHLDGDRPGDLLEEQVAWEDILSPAGWHLARTRGEIGYWTRPGKSDGISASTNALGTDRLHVFTSSAAPFEPDTSYSKFGAWALLHTAGDFAEAARQLRQGVST
jgi:hypothetical protein